MKKQYIFLIMIGIILYIGYLILSFTYKEYKINTHIDYITKTNQEIRENIAKAREIIKYKNSLAYKNKILKEQQSYKNKGEDVIYLTTEKKYNKFTREVIEDDIIINKSKIYSKLDNMTIPEKWLYLLLKKENY